MRKLDLVTLSERRVINGMTLTLLERKYKWGQLTLDEDANHIIHLRGGEQMVVTIGSLARLPNDGTVLKHHRSTEAIVIERLQSGLEGSSRRDGVVDVSLTHQSEGFLSVCRDLRLGVEQRSVHIKNY